ncbi:uncharacterized protein LOC142223675 isoform X1 [Haematobia irritans]|uniref:uncharacterized protein LOC142223675 isoform X1 n=2 Tax=Haematobia irritans TaxID=7368 RepID=UPI003F4F8CAF
MKYILQFITLLTCIQLKMLLANPVDTSEATLEHTDSRLKHFIQRLDIMAKHFESKYLPELQQLKATFENSLNNNTLKDKLLLLESYGDKLNMDFLDYFHTELDRQYINEDIQLVRWYVLEILPDLSGQLADEAKKFSEKISQALTEENLDRKLDLYNEASESDALWDYLNDSPEPEPVLNVHLKFYQDCLNYLLTQGLFDQYEKEIRNYLQQVNEALSKSDYREKLKVVELFDDASTKLGSFLHEKVIAFEIHKFGQ